MVVWGVVGEFFYVHSGHTCGCELKTAVFVACLECKVAVVLVFDFVFPNIVGLDVCDHIVVSVVLIHVEFEIALWVWYWIVGMGNGKVDLLVFFVDVDFGTCGYFHIDGYLCFYNAKTGCKYRIMWIFVSVNLYGVVS